MLIVAALGTNALWRRGEPQDAQRMERNACAAARALAPVARHHQLVVTHGSGPQMGLLALQATAHARVPAYPLDLLGAQNEGMLGYLLCRELRNCLPGRQMASLMTQTVVSERDDAFAHPDKFVGPEYGPEESGRLASERGWRFAPDGENFRRVVASPSPCRILELPLIEQLVRDDTLVVCAGGGGVPVAIDESGRFHGVEAVVDKDRASAWLATELGADVLLFLTNVDGVYRDWGTPTQRRIDSLSVAGLDGQPFATGSMAEKLEGACRFMRAGGTMSVIGAIDDAVAMLEGSAGTRIDR